MFVGTHLLKIDPIFEDKNEEKCGVCENQRGHTRERVLWCCRKDREDDLWFVGVLFLLGMCVDDFFISFLKILGEFEGQQEARKGTK